MKYIIIILSVFLLSCSNKESEIGYTTQEVEAKVSALLDKYEETDSVEYLKDALAYVSNEDNEVPNMLKADVYVLMGNFELLQGRGTLSTNYLLDAIKLCENNSNTRALETLSKSYYYLSTIYFSYDIDTVVENILPKMRTLIELDNKFESAAHYYYYSTYVLYHSVMFKQSNNVENVDSMILYSHKILNDINKYDERKERDLAAIKSITYNNLAAAYTYGYLDEKIDSVYYYMDLAYRDTELIKSKARQNRGKISYHNFYAWLYLKLREYDKAIYHIHIVDELLENVNLSPIKNRTMRNEVRRFYVAYYSALGDKDKIIEAQQLLIEQNQKLYDTQNANALMELNIKHEVEKKDLDNEYLKQKNAEMQMIVIASIIIIVIFFSLIVTLIILSNKNKAHELFEAAIEADAEKESKALNEQLLLEKIKFDYPQHKNLFDQVDANQLTELFSDLIKPLSVLEKRYVICFLVGIKPSEIAEMFSVEQATVYTLKARIKKKFRGNIFPVL